jgi:DNA-binding protein HU-beta
MNKKDIINALSKKTGLTKSKAADAFKIMTDSITGALKKGEKVSLIGFGSFDIVKRKARNGRNPSTGDKMKIKASNAPRFRAGKALKDAVNKKK